MARSGACTRSSVAYLKMLSFTRRCFSTHRRFDVIVVGGGHAGSEAASASARMGASTLLITHKLSTVGAMSCNPAFGGIGKGTLVREIDALGGIMGRGADKAGIHFRILNRSKGPAVYGPRAQADRETYSSFVQNELKNTPNLHIVEGSVEDFTVTDGKVTSATLDNGDMYEVNSMIITTGTFLGGMIFIGPKESFPGGRIADNASTKLSEAFRKLGLKLRRLTTSTPPRLYSQSIDFSELTKQESDDPPTPFSYLNDRIENPLITCFATMTNPSTHQIIRDNLHMLPTFSESRGPRYCPSIEGKITRFPDKDGHQVWLEPEGKSGIVYPGGLSTGFPLDVQIAMLRSMEGLKDVQVAKPGYAVEYDYVDPRELSRDLQVKSCSGLFLAGQINGSTGYEEAGAQGIVAGINAAAHALSKPKYIPDRGSSLIGVLIDDLVSKGADEPYRMFSSRSEYRLLLRADNADMRLTREGYALGVVPKERMEVFQKKEDTVKRMLELLKETQLPSSLWSRELCVSVSAHGKLRSADEMLRYPDVSLEAVMGCLKAQLKDASKLALISQVASHSSVMNCIEVEAKYSLYIDKQRKEVETLKREDFLELPKNIDYMSLDYLSNEEKEKLNRIRPLTLRDVNAIQGVKPGTALYLYALTKKLTKSERKKQRAAREFITKQTSRVYIVHIFRFIIGTGPGKTWKSFRSVELSIHESHETLGIHHIVLLYLLVNMRVLM